MVSNFLKSNLTPNSPFFRSKTLFTYYVKKELTFISKIISWVCKPVGIKHRVFKGIILSIINTTTDFHNNKCWRAENIQKLWTLG